MSNMHSSLLISLFLASCGVFVVSQEANIITTTSAIFKQEKLKFVCSPSQTFWQQINSVTLSKNISGRATLQQIVTVFLRTVDNIRNVTQWSSAVNWQSRVTVIRQYVNPRNGAGLEFDIPPEQVQCSDEGTYHCTVAGLDMNSISITKSKTGTVALKVLPANVNQIEVRPIQSEMIYNAGSSVTLTCTGTVGRPAVKLLWCYKRLNMNSFSGWPFEDRDVVQGDPVITGCQNFGRSVFTYNVSADDTYIEFKCVPDQTTENACNRLDSLSANITIFRYTNPVNPEGQDADTGNAGEIAGAVIGSFIGIVLIIVIVYFVAFRNKNKGESYRTKEENGTAAAPIDNTVYSVPHHERDRHQPAKDRSPRGHYENKGMDEPHTRGRPVMDPRGRSNPGLERSIDDVRDGGNGLRNKDFMGSNASFGSAV